MSVAWILCAVFVGATAFGLAAYLRPAGEPVPDRLVAALLPVGATLVAAAFTAEFLAGFYRPWNDARLGPAAAWLRGYRLYYGINEGPVLGMMYPPLAALMYLPAVLVSTPFRAVATGQIMTMVYFFLPALWVLWAGAKARDDGSDPGGRRLAALSTLAFCLFSIHSPPLWGAAFWIHADAPALAFGTGASAAILIGTRPIGIGRLALSALWAVLAVLTKQVMLPLLVALPICCLLLHGRRAFGWYVLALLLMSGAAGLALVGLVDLRAMWLNAIELPARQPWKWARLEALARVTWEMASACWLPVSTLTLCAMLNLGIFPRREPLFRDRVETNRWMLWALIGLFLVPTSVLGRAKVGGSPNAMAYAVYFLALAALLALRARTGTAREPHGSRPIRPSVEMALLAIAVLFVPAAARELPMISPLARLLPESPERTGYRFAKEHPGTVYFPFCPLITLMSEGRAYHFSDGIYNRRLAGFDVSEEQIREFLPPALGLVAFTDSTDYSQQYLPDFSRRVSTGDLRRWKVFAR